MPSTQLLQSPLSLYELEFLVLAIVENATTELPIGKILLRRCLISFGPWHDARRSARKIRFRSTFQSRVWPCGKSGIPPKCQAPLTQAILPDVYKLKTCTLAPSVSSHSAIAVSLGFEYAILKGKSRFPLKTGKVLILFHSFE